MVPQEKRGGALAVYSVAPLLGPVIGPVAGGFLVAAKGWPWVFWVLAMVGGAMTLLCLALLRETFAIVILERRAARLRKQTGDSTIRSQLSQNLNAGQLFARAIVRPSKILILSPIVSALSLYMGVVYGYRMPLQSPSPRGNVTATSAAPSSARKKKQRLAASVLSENTKQISRTLPALSFQKSCF